MCDKSKCYLVSSLVILVVTHSCLSYTTTAVPNYGRFEYQRVNIEDDVVTDDKRSPIDDSHNKNSSNLYSMVRHCVQQPEIFKCFKKQTVLLLDDMMQTNESMLVNDYIALAKNPNWNFTETNATGRSDDLDETLKSKLYNLAESRMIQFKLGSDGQEADVQEGRKKHGGKGGKKGGMMIGLFALAALFLQMKLGKIAMLAGVAFILAKISLLVSLLSALKKMMGNNAGGDHVVYAADSGHSSYGSSSGGWQRSYVEPVSSHDLIDPFKGQKSSPGDLIDNAF